MRTRGRPRKGQGRKVVSLTLPAPLWAQVVDCAQGMSVARGRLISRSECVETLLRRALDDGAEILER